MTDLHDGSNETTRPSPTGVNSDITPTPTQPADSPRVHEGPIHHLTIKQAGDGLCFSDQHGIIVFVNERLCEMLGGNTQDLLGQPASKILIPDKSDGNPATSEACPECGCFHHQAILKRIDGSSMKVAFERQTLVDSQGQHFGVLDTIMDLPEKARLEQAFQDNAEWHRLIVESLNDIFWVAEVDNIDRSIAITLRTDKAIDLTRDMLRRWKFTYVSSSYERMFGLPISTALSWTPYDAIPEMFYDLLEREIARYVHEAVSNPLGASFPDTVITPGVTPSNRPYWCETSARVLYDERKKILRFVGVTRDVTKHLLAEEAVRTNEQKLGAICDVAQDAIIMMDSDGKAIHWNPAAEKMFGYHVEEVIGRDIHILLAPSRLHEKINRGIAQFRNTGEGPVIGNVVQSEAIRKDGTEFPVEIAVSPLTLDGRRAAVGVIRDITERVLAEEAVRKEQQRLARLLDVYESHRKMATYEIHDGVTQPLVSVLMTFDAFSSLRNAYPEAPWNEFDNAVAVLREALAETRRFMSGMRPPILDELGVVAAVDHIIREHRVSGSMTVDFKCDVQFERLCAPLETVVFRIIQEGLNNAHQHSQTDRVLVEIAERENRLEIRVQDWGVGFDPEQVPQDRFGLEGIRERANAIGGSARIDSRPGKGTTIFADLPLLHEQADDR